MRIICAQLTIWFLHCTSSAPSLLAENIQESDRTEFYFYTFPDLRFFNSIHFNYNNSNNETISSSRNSAVASCVIVCQCSAVNARTNENISSSSLSASVPLSNILIGLSSTRSWTKKLHHWTPEKRQKRLRWVPGSNKCERIFSSHLYQHSPTTKTKSYQFWQVCLSLTADNLK